MYTGPYDGGPTTALSGGAIPTERATRGSGGVRRVNGFPYSLERIGQQREPLATELRRDGHTIGVTERVEARDKDSLQ